MSRSREIRHGAKVGFGLGALFSLWAIIVAALNLSFTIPLRGSIPVNVFAVIATYLLVGILGGALVGALRPLLKWRLGSIGVMTGVAFLFFGAVRLSIEGLKPWTSDDTFVVGATTLIGGIAGGLIVWHGLRESDRRRS